MIIFNREGKDYNFRNEEKEVTALELAKIGQVMAKEGVFFEKWMSVTELLGDKGLSDVIDEDGLMCIIENMHLTNIANEVPEKITINGRDYIAKIEGGKIVRSGRDLVKIEEAAKKGGNWVVEAMAICYKDSQLTSVEHYTPAHIQHKTKLFSDNVMCDVAAPVFYQVGKGLIDNIERVSNAISKPIQ